MTWNLSRITAVSAMALGMSVGISAAMSVGMSLGTSAATSAAMSTATGAGVSAATGAAPAPGQATAQPAPARPPSGKPTAPPPSMPSQRPAQTPAQAAAPMPEPQGYSYTPDGRRDPFVSLLRKGSDGERQTLGTRPAGLAGLAASEVVLKGTMQSPAGFVALLRGVDNKTYIVRPGDKLLDGTIRTITANAMVILQQVSDPLSLRKDREVRKVLRQADEVR